jgi:ABC transporter fused permease/ATP-binding protein
MKTEKLSEALWLRIFKLAKPELKVLLIGTIFLAISSTSNLVYPQLVRTMIDGALGSKQMSKINEVGLIMLGIFFVQAIASALRYYLFTMAGERVVLKLRKDLYSHILDQEIAFFDFNRTGELMSRISSDATVLQNTVSVNISMGLRNIVGAIGGLAMMIYTSPRLALAMLLVVPPIAFGAGIFGRRIRNYSKKSQDALAEASTVAEETMSGMRTVRSFAQEDYEKGRYNSALSLSLRAARGRILQISWFTGIASMLGYFAITGVLWYGGKLVVRNEMSVGDLTQFLLYLLIMAVAVGALGSLWGDFMGAVGAAKRIFDILDKTPEVQNHSGQKIANLKGELKFSNVSFAYPSRLDIDVLKDFNLDLKPGQTLALVGPSGSGKTTVASLLSRFYDPISGTISLDNQDLKSLEPHWVRRQIGLVSQEPILISSSIEENIKYGNEQASHEDVIRAAQQANAEEFILKFPGGYATLVGERGIQLSGGQKQRVAIARALLKDPRILILDEATSALDTESEALVQEALSRLMKGRTTLIIAHRLATIQNADIICVIENGRIQQKGSHQELLKEEKGIYRRLIERQLSNH